MEAPLQATANYLTKPPLDILRGQAITQENSDTTHVIPIKKIGDLGFGNVKKPTEIIPDKNITPQNEKGAEKVAEQKTINIFVPPNELVRYLKELMVRDGKRLYLLFFDIQYSSSIEEVFNYINNKDLGLTDEERSKALAIIGYTDNYSKISPEKKEETSASLENASEFNTPISLDEARVVFAEEFSKHLAKIKQNKANFAKMMQSLGAEREMPRVDEPTELVLAKKDYLDLRNKAESASDDKELFRLDELLLLRNEMLKQEADKTQKITERGFKKWNMLMQDSNANAITGLLGDVRFIDSFPPEEPGLREDKVEVSSPNPMQEGVKVLETQNEVVSEVISNPAEIPIKEPEIKPKLEASETAKSFETEFNGNKVVMLYSISNNGPEVTVFYGGQEIGSGLVSKGKAKLKVQDKYKTSFFLEDSEEEKALKVATNFLKKLKLN
jgi:hypothetical protein